MLSSLAGLPGPQRDALGTVFGLSAGEAPGRLLVGLAAPGLSPGLRIKVQRGVGVELPEQHQPGAALRLPDQRAELLIGGTHR